MPTVQAVQEALKKCLGEEVGIHVYNGNGKQRCRVCDHSESFILHMKPMLALLR